MGSGLKQAAEEAEQESSFCFQQEEEEETLETGAAGCPRAAILVWSSRQGGRGGPWGSRRGSLLETDSQAASLKTRQELLLQEECSSFWSGCSAWAAWGEDGRAASLQVPLQGEEEEVEEEAAVELVHPWRQEVEREGTEKPETWAWERSEGQTQG